MDGPKQGQKVRLKGQVREIGSPGTAHYAIKVGKERREVQIGGPCDIEVDGRLIHVDAGQASLVGGAVDSKGSYGELVALAHGVFPPDLAPSFAPGKLSASVLVPGDQVEVWGEVSALTADGTPGYREAPVMAIAVLRAAIIARGSRAGADLDRKLAEWHTKEAAPADPRFTSPESTSYRAPLGEWFPSLFCLTLGALAVVLERWWPRGMWPAGFALVAGALVFRPAPFETYRVRAGRTTDTSVGLVQALATIFYVVIACAFTKTTWLEQIVAFVYLGVLLGCELAYLRDTSRHRAIATARPWRGERGVRVCVEGRVEDATPVKVGGQQAALGRDLRGYVGRRMSGVNSNDFLNKGTFQLHTESGVLEVDPNDLVWGTTVQEKKWDSDGRHYNEYLLVPVGGQLAAVGWVEEGHGPLRLRPRGTTPVIALATSATGQPRALAARMVRRRSVSVLVLVLFAGALGYLASRHQGLSLWTAGPRVTKPSTTIHRHHKRR